MSIIKKNRKCVIAILIINCNYVVFITLVMRTGTFQFMLCTIAYKISPTNCFGRVKGVDTRTRYSYILRFCLFPSALKTV